MERCELVRYANRAIVDQYLAYLARPWTTGDPSAIGRSFQSECGDPRCDQSVELAIASFPDPPDPPDPPDAGSTPLLAPGHGSG